MQEYYNIDNILKEKANYYIIFGEKSNGKTYQVKIKEGIKHYLETGNRLILLRRWREDISQLWVDRYFNEDVDIVSLTNGKYNCINYYRKVLYLSNYITNEDGEIKVKRGEKIGYVMALSTEQHLSGASFLDVDTIIFEEFMERGAYISNEVAKFDALYSTIDRKQSRVRVFMVGNSISRVCPYISAWNLDKVFSSIKQGEIKTKDIINVNALGEETKIKIAIEYCKSSGGKSMALSSAGGMVDSGSWQTYPQPKLPKSKKCYKILYRFGFQFKNFKFLCELLEDKENFDLVWFIFPYYNDFKKKMLVISDEIKTSPYYQCDIYNLSIKNEKLKRLLQTFKENKIFYSNDLCGTDFKQVINFLIRR